ncbi:hypothetical protein [Hymenobacter aerilatus]|nr:hypothetical protein [Hymenobacter aerilatus]
MQAFCARCSQQDRHFLLHPYFDDDLFKPVALVEQYAPLGP